jgi:hypothetical protein
VGRSSCETWCYGVLPEARPALLNLTVRVEYRMAWRFRWLLTEAMSDAPLVGGSVVPVRASCTAVRGPKSRADGDTAVTAQRYGPGDTWPSHQMPYWNKALGEARGAGWTLTHIDAPHLFGTVSCPAGEHTFSVDKTAQGGETKSKEAIKKIRWCQHGTGRGGSRVQERKEECIRLLGVADQLIAQAAEGLALAEAKQTAQENLDRLEVLLQTATSNVEMVLADQEAALQAAIEVDDAPEGAPDGKARTRQTVPQARKRGTEPDRRAERPLGGPAGTNPSRPWLRLLGLANRLVSCG